jgi:hypothetical protein
MIEKRSFPAFIHRPPRVHPIAALVMGFVCVPAGLMIQGAIGGGLIGGGIGCLLMGLWDIFRLKMGLVHKRSEESLDPHKGRIE